MKILGCSIPRLIICIRKIYRYRAIISPKSWVRICR